LSVGVEVRRWMRLDVVELLLLRWASMDEVILLGEVLMERINSLSLEAMTEGLRRGHHGLSG
jgi:hypothetical protein